MFYIYYVEVEPKVNMPLDLLDDGIWNLARIIHVSYKRQDDDDDNNDRYNSSSKPMSISSSSSRQQQQHTYKWKCMHSYDSCVVP